MTQTKLITTVHWNVPQKFKDYIDNNKDNHFLVFGGGSVQKVSMTNGFQKTALQMTHDKTT